MDKKCLKKLDLSTSFCLRSHSISNDKKWMKPFLFFHLWPSGVTYINYFTNINFVMNYFYLQSLTIQKYCFPILNFEGENNVEKNLCW